MKYEMMPRCGELGIELGKVEGPGARVTKDFLGKLLKRIVVRSKQYFDETRTVRSLEHVFAYREKQLHSVVCPSIADITPFFLIEHPLKRKPKGDVEYRGTVDYWIYYKNYSFLMELKHAYFAYRNASNPRKDITRKFTRALEQLADVKKKECGRLTLGRGLREIALEAIVFYKGSKEEDAYAHLKNDAKIHDFRILFRKMVKNTKLKRKSHLRAIWILDKKLVEPIEYANSYEIYPAVAFVGNISEIIE